MTPTVLYIGIAAGVAIVGGVGYAIYEHFHTACPTTAEFTAILAAIDSGKTGVAEANVAAARFDAQGCHNEAAAVRRLLAAKSSRGTLGGLTIASTPQWPDTDPKCKAAIDALPRTPRPNPTGGSTLPSFYEATRKAASDARASGDPRGLRNYADLLESAAVEVGKTDMMAASTLKTAAVCLRDYADTITTKKAVAPPAYATKGHVTGRVTGVGLGRFIQRPGRRFPPWLWRRFA